MKNPQKYFIKFQKLFHKNPQKYLIKNPQTIL